MIATLNNSSIPNLGRRSSSKTSMSAWNRRGRLAPRTRVVGAMQQCHACLLFFAGNGAIHDRHPLGDQTIIRLSNLTSFHNEPRSNETSSSGGSVTLPPHHASAAVVVGEGVVSAIEFAFRESGLGFSRYGGGLRQRSI